MVALEQMDSYFESSHFLANTSILQLLCERTSTPKNLLLQNSLLAWVICSLAYRALKEVDGRHVALSSNATRVSWLFRSQTFYHFCEQSDSAHYYNIMSAFFFKDEVLKQLGCELALRRIVQYLSNKLASKEDSKVRLCDAFGTWASFEDQWKGSEEFRKEFLHKCSPREVEACTFCELAMDGGLSVHSILLEATSENFLQPAEAIFQRQEWVQNQILDLEELMKDSLPDAAEPAAQEAEDAKLEDALDTETGTTTVKPVSAMPSEEFPDMPAADIQQPEAKERRSFFKILDIPEWAEDLLQKVSLSTFEHCLAHAKTCPIPSDLP